MYILSLFYHFLFVQNHLLIPRKKRHLRRRLSEMERKTSPHFTSKRTRVVSRLLKVTLTTVFYLNTFPKKCGGTYFASIEVVALKRIPTRLFKPLWIFHHIFAEKSWDKIQSSRYTVWLGSFLQKLFTLYCRFARYYSLNLLQETPTLNSLMMAINTRVFLALILLPCAAVLSWALWTKYTKMF